VSSKSWRVFVRGMWSTLSCEDGGGCVSANDSCVNTCNSVSACDSPNCDSCGWVASVSSSVVAMAVLLASCATAAVVDADAAAAAATTVSTAGAATANVSPAAPAAAAAAGAAATAATAGAATVAAATSAVSDMAGAGSAVAASTLAVASFFGGVLFCFLMQTPQNKSPLRM